MYNIPLSFLISHFSSLISVQCLFCIVFPCPPVKTITLIRLVNMKLKEQHILKDSFKYSYDTIADIAPPINRYYSQHCYNPPPMNSVLRGRNRNAIFAKSPHGPIFKFLWWFVKWLSENGTNPSTGEILTLISHLLTIPTMTTLFGNSSRINKA